MMRKPKKMMGIASRTVKPKLMIDETTLASGGASISEHQYALRKDISELSLKVVRISYPIVKCAPNTKFWRYRV